MDDLELRIIEKIKPKKDESNAIFFFVDQLLAVAERVAKPFSAYPVIVGSIAKDTFLKNGYDVDLFIVFREKIKREKLEEFGLLIGTTISEDMGGKYNLKYAEHPYVRAEISGHSVDIVPCYEFTAGNKVISAVDRSPLHTRYVKEHLTGYMKDQARLMKYFCKQTDVYGADARHEGVSGYLCELFIIQWGSFAKALEKISKLDFRSYIDIDGISSEREAKKQFREALIFIDPTDKDRNVASPLSPQNFFRLKKEAKKYTEGGSFPALKKKVVNLLVEKLKSERGTSFAGARFRPPEMVPENLYPQLRRFERHLARHLHENGFGVVRHLSWTDEENLAVIVVEVESSTLSRYRSQAGPTIFSGEIDNFLEKYLGGKYPPYIERGQFFATVKRRLQNVDTAVKDFLSNRREEIPGKISEQKIRVLKEEEIIELSRENKDFNSYLAGKYLEI